MLNAAPVPGSIDGLFDDVDVLVVNEHELAGIARLLPNHRDGDDMALLAAASGASVVCTAGADGAVRPAPGPHPITSRHRRSRPSTPPPPVTHSSATWRPGSPWTPPIWSGASETAVHAASFGGHPRGCDRLDSVTARKVKHENRIG